MNPTIINLSLYCQFEDDQLIGTDRRNVDDLLRARTGNWKIHSKAILERSETSGNRQSTFTIVRIHITDFENMCHFDKDFYMSKIEKIPSCTEFSKFASMRV